MENSDWQARASALLSEFTFCFERGTEQEMFLIRRSELEALKRLEQTDCKACARITVLRGAKGTGKKFVLTHLAKYCDFSLLFIDVSRALKHYDEYGSFLIDILDERIRSMDAKVCMCNLNHMDETEEFKLWGQFLQEFTGLGLSCFVAAEEEILIKEPDWCEKIEISFKALTRGQREEVWAYFLNVAELEPEVNPEILSRRFGMTVPEMRQIMRSARLYAAVGQRSLISLEDIRRAAASLCPEILGQYAERIPCVFGWDDFVADDEIIYRLKLMCSQVRYREMVGEQWGFYEKRSYGSGVTVLFCGPSGTGKTMAAQVAAADLGMELYRVDLSRISSKYIGETQKNISELFVQARDKNAILFFDEADALFSKRTEVKDANDRHSNAEIAHLLQKLEFYDGVVILATNLKNNFDDAFRRRIRIVVNFRMPDKKVRRVLWRKALPERAPLHKELDLDFFADRFEMSAGEIKETAILSAYIAAEKGEMIYFEHICQALKICMEKYGRRLTEMDFS